MVLPSQESTHNSIQGVAVFGRKHIAATREGVEGLVALASTLRAEVGRQAKEAKAKVKEVVRTIPLDRLYELPPLGFHTPEPEQAAVPRS